MMYEIETIEEVYDDYDEDGYAAEDSELLCSSAFIKVNGAIDDLVLSKEIQSKHNVDYVLVKQKGSIDVIHIAHERSRNYIVENGLTGGDGDFGYGLYAIKVDDEVALDNLKTWIVDEFRASEDNLLVCNIHYSGEYYQCISEGCNEGYLILDEDYAELKSIDTVPINKFL